MNGKSLLRLLMCLCPVVLAIFCLASSEHQKSRTNPFPEDLMYNGSPIHPSCVVATQFGDSSRLEPQAIISTIADEHRNWGHRIHRYGYDIYFIDKTVREYCEYFCGDQSCSEDEYQPTECCSNEYRYIGSYKNKHIVITQHYDTDGTGRFLELGLVTRNGDTICNAGEITGGDRAHGGTIEVISLNDNILRFKQIATPASLENIISSPYSANLPHSSLSDGLWLIYEVDLDDSQLKLAFSGISFLNESDRGSDENDAGACFYKLARESIDAGKQTLNVVESKTFAQNVWEAIAALQIEI